MKKAFWFNQDDKRNFWPTKHQIIQRNKPISKRWITNFIYVFFNKVKVTCIEITTHSFRQLKKEKNHTFPELFSYKEGKLEFNTPINSLQPSFCIIKSFHIARATPDRNRARVGMEISLCV